MPIKWVKWLNYLFFRIFRIFATFYNFPFYMGFWVFKWRLSLTRCVYGFMEVWSTSCKSNVIFAPIYGVENNCFHERDPFNRPTLFIFSRTDSKLQSTLLHQCFICCWHIELVDVVEIYIAPTFHIILQSL